MPLPSLELLLESPVGQSCAPLLLLFEKSEDRLIHFDRVLEKLFVLTLSLRPILQEQPEEPANRHEAHRQQGENQAPVGPLAGLVWINHLDRSGGQRDQ